MVRHPVDFAGANRAHTLLFTPAEERAFMGTSLMQEYISENYSTLSQRAARMPKHSLNAISPSMYRITASR